MDTNCKDCTFYRCEPNNTNTPGLKNICELGKIDFYRNNQVNVIGEIGNIILKDFICPFKRGDSWEQSDEYDSIEEQIINENGFPYSVFMYENEKINLDLELNKFLNLDIKPKYIHITFKYMHQDEPLLKRLSNKIEAKGIKYKLVINMDEILDHFYESYLAFRLNLKTPFVAICYGPYPGRPNIMTELSHKIQKELLSFPYAYTRNKNLLIFPTSILEEYISIEGEHFITKILETQCQGYRL